MNTTVTPRRRLLRTTGWFACTVALLLLLLGTQYLSHYVLPDQCDARLYTVLAYTSHMAVLAFLPWLLLVAPLCLLLPRPGLVLPLSALLAAAGAAWLLLDALLFAEQQFHLNALTMTLLGWQTLAFGVLYFVIFAALGGLDLRWLWRRTAVPARRNRGGWVAAGVLGALLVAQLQHVWADAHYYVPITGLTHYLPLYYPATAKRILVRHGWVDLEQNRERQLLAKVGRRTGQMRYPQSPLQCSTPQPRYNLVMVLVDCMRDDMLNGEVAPRLSHFADRAEPFLNHFSGGNASRMGVFSLFYGLPATYWQQVESTQQPPVLMQQVLANGYQLGIFGSSPLYRPVSLDRTAFARVPDLRMETPSTTDRAYERDWRITQEWLGFLDGRDPDRPFFSFLFYDSPNAKDAPDDYPVRFFPEQDTEMARRFAAYRTAIHYSDSLIGEVLDDLERRGLLEETIVLVTADHGEGFDEDGLGFAGHGNAFDRRQLRVPFVLAWPGRTPARHAHRTSHDDWVVTVMQELFGCTNPATDYASGRSLFDGTSWDWLIAGGYHNFAILEPDQVIVNQVRGGMEVRDLAYRLKPDPKLHQSVIAQALRETSRFYR